MKYIKKQIKMSFNLDLKDSGFVKETRIHYLS